MRAMCAAALLVAFYLLGNGFAMAHSGPHQDGWVDVGGNVYSGGTPVCALVLINGQTQFSCDGTGRYDMQVPVDDNGMITVMVFADGFAPFNQTVTPEQAAAYPINILLDRKSPSFQVETTYEPSATEGWFVVSGTINSGTTPVCALTLANGQSMFSCAENLGKFSLDVPPDQDGNITLMVFAAGFKPFKITIDTEEVLEYPLYVQPYLIIPEDTSSDYRVEEELMTRRLNRAFAEVRAWYLARLPGKDLDVRSYIPVYSPFSKKFHECRDTSIMERGVSCNVNDPYFQALRVLRSELGVDINTWENKPCNVRSVIMFYKHHPGYAGAYSANNPESSCTYVDGLPVYSTGGTATVGSAVIYGVMGDAASTAECLAEYERWGILRDDFPANFCGNYNTALYTIAHELGHTMGVFDYCGTGDINRTGITSMGLPHPDREFIEGWGLQDCLIDTRYLPFRQEYWDKSVMGAAHYTFPFATTSEGLNEWEIEALRRDPYFHDQN